MLLMFKENPYLMEHLRCCWGTLNYGMLKITIKLRSGLILWEKYFYHQLVTRFIGDKGVIRSSLESRYLQGHINIDWVLTSPQHIWGVVDIEYALNQNSKTNQKLFSKVYFIAPENSISQITFGARVNANNKWT